MISEVRVDISPIVLQMQRTFENVIAGSECENTLLDSVHNF